MPLVDKINCQGFLIISKVNQYQQHPAPKYNNHINKLQTYQITYYNNHQFRLRNQLKIF